MDDTGSHIKVAPELKKKGLKNNNNQKKSNVIFLHPFNNQSKKIRITLTFNFEIVALVSP